MCEDTKSSKFYFQSFSLNRVQIEAVGTGMNTDRVVKEAIALKRKAEDRGEPYIEVWCVFDRDSFPAGHFNKALDLAKGEGLKVAWSNECFELWYLLHFEFRQTAISRSELQRILSKRLGVKYSKSGTGTYRMLEPRQSEAISNARRLEKYWNDLGGCNPCKHNPSTGIHRLVARLNEFK